MSKSLPASDKVMKNYLSELLTDDETDANKQVYDSPAKKDKLEKLLNQVHITEQVKPDVITTVKSERSIKKALSLKDKKAAETKLVTSKSQAAEAKTGESVLDRESFQAMFFEVAGLTIAVPLVELGGIHNVSEPTKLMGKPSWFKGVMINREQKINVVDTAQWVMPEKCDETLINSLNYQYVIMLSNSQWGLSAEHLVDTVTLKANDVKWLDSGNKRPWLAGLVKERMCALLDVKSMINLLNEGENIYQK